ncbi:uncharacterized protein LOC112342020 isoform X1 [Selaginella moellendorffii]|uniref:uncharacterized protein LOC112342020 isoform X1 n=1 Tax=Selaginella moellendorffii TaxID=88036 RepID=UPI000D1C2923|nr:uncharacterized protein LOC112342020 isoform X1 [Selaginella moellendorffii]|eukprot:XP_024518905.1 uncharacterized protein LOC112342020 isoform X1 [Selaginella moellendorffii]
MGSWRRIWEDDGCARSSSNAADRHRAVMELDTDGVFVNDDPLRRIRVEATGNGRQDRPVTKKITLVTKRKAEITVSSASGRFVPLSPRHDSAHGVCSLSLSLSLSLSPVIY